MLDEYSNKKKQHQPAINVLLPRFVAWAQRFFVFNYNFFPLPRLHRLNQYSQLAVAWRRAFFDTIRLMSPRWKFLCDEICASFEATLTLLKSEMPLENYNFKFANVHCIIKVGNCEPIKSAQHVSRDIKFIFPSLLSLQKSRCLRSERPPSAIRTLATLV